MAGKGTTKKEPESLGVDNVEQIRDIIFGSQMRDYEQRFIRLEERVLDESESLRSETNNRLDALEVYIKQEVVSLVEQITAERGEREDDIRHLSNEATKAQTLTDKKNIQTQEKLKHGLSESRDALLEQSKTLLTEIQNVRNGLSEQMNKGTQQLNSDKTDKKALADMFNEFAMRLNGSFKLPDNKS